MLDTSGVVVQVLITDEGTGVDTGKVANDLANTIHEDLDQCEYTIY